MGYIIGNIWQGFGVAWWKNKHNTHHAVPNMEESEANNHDGTFCFSLDSIVYVSLLL